MGDSDSSAMDLSLAAPSVASIARDDDDDLILLSPPVAAHHHQPTQRVDAVVAEKEETDKTIDATVVDIKAIESHRVLFEMRNGSTRTAEIPRFLPADELAAQLTQVVSMCLPIRLAWPFKLACANTMAQRPNQALARALADCEPQTRPTLEWLAILVAFEHLLGSSSSPRQDGAFAQWKAAQLDTLQGKAPIPQRETIGRYIPALTLSIHLLHEEWSLRAPKASRCMALRRDILLPLVDRMGWRTYVEYHQVLHECSLWALEVPLAVRNLPLAEEPLLDKQTVPSISAFCLNSINKQQALHTISLALVGRLLVPPADTPFLATTPEALASITPLLTKLTILYNALARPTLDTAHAFEALIESRLSRTEIEELPWSIAWPIQELSHLARSLGVLKAAILYDSSTDDAHVTATLPKLLWLRSSTETRSNENTTSRSQSSPLSIQFTSLEKATGMHNHSDGTDFSFVPIGLRFAKDLRIYEAQRLLSSGRPILLRPSDRPELSDHDQMVEYQGQLAIVTHRILALPTGRGIFTLGTAAPQTWHTVSVPELITTGKVVGPQILPVTPEEQIRQEVLAWPQFHNGVAAGLRIPRTSSTFQLDSSWLRYNNPLPADYNAWGGVLLGIGLNGHLGSQTYDLYAVLSSCHELASVGTLLGVAASKIGTMDSVAEHMIYPHVPALLPHQALELPTPALVQTAAVFALGLLYQGTCHRRITEVLLEEICKGHIKQGTFGTSNNPIGVNVLEAYSLNAALALGLVLLGRGNSVASLVDLKIASRLLAFMDPASSTNVSTMTPGVAPVRAPTHVTSPGATLAYGLIFLRTNDAIAAEHLALPQSPFALDYFRPDVLLLRTMAQGLIMWDSILPSRASAEDICPPFIRQQTKKTSHALASAYQNIVAGRCLLIGLRFAGTMNREACDTLYHYLNKFDSELNSIGRTAAMTTQRMSLQTCVIVVVQALSLVLAGSGDLELLRRIRKLHSHVSEDLFGYHMGIHMALGFLFLSGGTASLRTDNLAVAMLITSLYPRYPSVPGDNKYHLQALRHMYVLAVEHRCLITMDASTETFVAARVCVHTSDHQVIALNTPCLLPELSLVQRVSVDDDRYWKQDVAVRTGPGGLVTCAVKLRSSEKLLLQFDDGVLPSDVNMYDSGTTRSFVKFLCLDDLTAPSRLPTLGLATLTETARALFRKAFGNSHLQHLPILLVARLAANALDKERDDNETDAMDMGSPSQHTTINHLRVLNAFAEHVAPLLRTDQHRFLFETAFVPGELDLLLGC